MMAKVETAEEYPHLKNRVIISEEDYNYLSEYANLKTLRILNNALSLKEQEHCKDCCCAKSWEALGIKDYTGKSIPEEIVKLKKEKWGILELEGLSLRQETEARILGIIGEETDKDKIYPTDIFKEVSPFQLSTINDLLTSHLGFTMDRLSAHIGRLLLSGLKDSIISKIKEEKESRKR